MSLRAVNARTQNCEVMDCPLKADDRNRMDGLLRRGGRDGFYDGPTVTHIIEEADNRLFNSIGL